MSDTFHVNFYALIKGKRVGRVSVGVSSDAHISTILDRIADNKLTCNFILELNTEDQESQRID